jgi:hypothetical protein
MTERRYSEDEVAEILDRATDTGGGSAPGAGSGTGMTLRELQEIGDEVGISREVIARAAAELDRPVPDRSMERRVLGAKLAVGRSVELPRRLTDDEWNNLVVDLRMTFDAKGKIRDEGAFRQWTNGNLQALLEPTESGHRLRLRTLKGQAIPFMGVGGFMLGLSVFTAVTSALSGGALVDPDTVLLAAMGAGFFGWARIPLPHWARTRERQMEDIIARLQAKVTSSGEPDGA